MKSVNDFKLTGKLAHICIIKVRRFSGVKTSCMNDYIKLIIIEKSPEHNVLDVEANGLNSSRTPAENAEEIEEIFFNPTFLQKFRKMLDAFSLKYSSVLITGDFNLETKECDLKNVCEFII